MSIQWWNNQTLENICFSTFATDDGVFSLAFSNDVVALLDFPLSDEQRTLERIREELRKLHPKTRIVETTSANHHPAAKQVKEYLSGKREQFDLVIAPGISTKFCRSVWKATAAIPYGQTLSYGELAREIGAERATRATGSALGKNPIPIVIPCHRVLGAHGCLGGFSGGLDWKRRLLELEKSRRPALV